MCEARVLLSPSSRSITRNRDAILKLKHGSPKLRDVLRSHFKERIRDKRNSNQDARRSIRESSPPFIFLNDLIEAEIDKETLDILLDIYEWNIEQQEYTEEERDIVDEYRRHLFSEEEINNFQGLLEQQVFCPFCMKGTITSKNLTCGICNEIVPCPNGLNNLEWKLQNATVGHVSCNLNYTFTKSFSPNIITLYCFTCNRLEDIVL